PMNNTISTGFTAKSIVLLFTAFTFMLTACEGPVGSEGPQGPQGEVGAVGPAGEDGSVMYAGKGAPTGDLGTEGDYYLNNNTGELYGPKDGKGWGNPIIVLMGDDGQDGADGKDGKDGSDIHAGKGKPAADLGVSGDFYLNQSNGDFYGPKTNKGWSKPTNLKGNDGQDGQDGSDGKDGKDGDDGSAIHAGTGAPAANLGKVGDFYLDKANGDFYGPKTNKSWGTPINLKGADGQDGTDGKDGQDGKDGKDGQDGSQMYAGRGAPNLKLGNNGDFYLDKSNYELYGPKTGSGWGSPINLKGADGNANVTRYLFPGHDFSDVQNEQLRISGLTEQEMQQSAWLVYLVTDEILPDREYYFSIPGEIGSTDYGLSHYFYGTQVRFDIHANSKDIRSYNRI